MKAKVIVIASIALALCLGGCAREPLIKPLICGNIYYHWSGGGI